MFSKLLFAAGAAFITLGAGETLQAATFDIVASGLNNPRGFTFGTDGALYVTEAGRGGTSDRCIASPSQPSANLCYGATGSVTRIHNGVSQRVVSGLPSIGLSNGNGSYGPQDIAFDSTGKPYVLVGFATNPAARDVVGVSDFAQLIRIDNLSEGGSWTNLADLGTYERLNNPDGEDVVTNPYSFVIKDNTAFIVDAGANDLLRVGLDGSGLATEAVFKSRIVTNPGTGNDISMQSVPTSIVTGSDGAFYTGELTGFPFPKGAARVYKVTPDGKPKVYADGFTQIIDVAFDSQDNLYVLEYGTEPLSNDPSSILDRTGELIRVAPDGTRTTIASDGLISPNSIAIGPDNDIYISNYATFAGNGEIIRIPAESVPEPTLTLGLLAFGIFGVASRWKRKQSCLAKTL